MSTLAILGFTFSTLELLLKVFSLLTNIIICGTDFVGVENDRKVFQKEETNDKKSKGKTSNADSEHAFKYRCDFCPEHFPSVKKLNSHRRHHTGEKPYVCPICCKAFRENVSYIIKFRSIFSQQKKIDHCF